MIAKDWRLPVSLLMSVAVGASCLPLQAAAPQKNPEAAVFVVEPEKRVPVAYDVDVVVCGGGIAGTIASISAARSGAKTLVIDRFGRFGGNIGPGMFCGGSVHFALQDENALVNRFGLGGVPQEFLRRTIEARPNADAYTEETRKELARAHLNVPGVRVGGGPGFSGYGYLVDSLAASYVAFKMMKEAGVEMLLSAYVADPIMAGNQVKGVFVETKSGRVAIKAKVVIDATGDGDVAFRANAPVEHRPPNCGLGYAVKDVDWDKYHAYLKEQGHKIDKYFNGDSLPKEADGFRYQKKIGDCTINIRSYGHGAIVCDRTGITGSAKVWDAKGLTLMEREHRTHLYEFVKFMRKHAPGWEKAHLLVTAPYLGARGGRSAVPEQPVTGKDVTAGRKFDDVIYVYYHDKGPHSCEMPYRILLPKKIEGLLLAGRSGLVYGPNFRQRYSVMLHGQAAGVAAALCVADGVGPRKLDVKKLQKALVKVGCPLGDEKRIRELGLKR